MASIVKRCGCPRAKWGKCRHSWTVRWWAGGTQHEKSFKRDWQEARRFSSRIEAEKVDSYGAPGPKPKRGVIYFIQADQGGPVKIGFSVGLQLRIQGLQNASPYELKVLLTVPGTLADERRLHRQFGEHHLRGEWFRPAPEILDYIDQQRAIVR